VISFQLARRLLSAGLRWWPGDGDRFFIPDRNLDEAVFSVSEMSVEVRPAPGGQLIAFNGTAEWALDSILQQEAVWLPSEAQLRELLGAAFRALQRTEDGYRCEVEAEDGQRLGFEHADAAEAYGLALLRVLETRQAAARS